MTSQIGSTTPDLGTRAPSAIGGRPTEPSRGGDDASADVGGYLSALRAAWPVLAFVVLAVTLLATAYSLVTPKTFSSTATVVSAGTADSGVSALDPGRLAAMATLATRPEVLALAAGSLHDVSVQQMSTAVTAKGDAAANAIEVTATSHNPSRAATMANAVARSFITYRETQREHDIAAARAGLERALRRPGEPKDVVDALTFGPLTSLVVNKAMAGPEFQLAVPASAPLSAPPLRTLETAALAFVAALVAGALAVAVREQVRPRARGRDGIRTATGIPTIVVGATPGRILSGVDRILARVRPQRPETGPDRAYDELGALVSRHLSESRPIVVLVAGVSERDDPGHVVDGLRHVLADGAVESLVVDANQRRPAVGRNRPVRGPSLRQAVAIAQGTHAGESSTGISTLAQYLDSVRDSPEGRDRCYAEDVRTVPLWSIPRSSLKTFFDSAQALRYRCLLVEVPSPLQYPDVQSLSPFADAIIFVTSGHSVLLETARALRGAVSELGIEPLGLVLEPGDQRSGGVSVSRLFRSARVTLGSNQAVAKVQGDPPVRPVAETRTAPESAPQP